MLRQKRIGLKSLTIACKSMKILKKPSRRSHSRKVSERVSSPRVFDKPEIENLKEDIEASFVLRILSCNLLAEFFVARIY